MKERNVAAKVINEMKAGNNNSKTVNKVHLG